MVTAQLDNITDVKKDASARILMLELTGGKKIEVNPGTVQQSITPQGCHSRHCIRRCDATDCRCWRCRQRCKKIGKRRLDTISGQLTAILGDTVFINNIKGTATKANTLLTSLNEFYDANKGTLQSTIQQLKGLTDDVRKAVNTNEPAVRSLLAKLETTTNDAQTL
jgi:ABC-type transporter Mla subunit MlaD